MSPSEATLGTAVVTGASAGIGAATAGSLRRAGFNVVIGARRMDALRAVAEPIGARALPLDVTDPDSVLAFCAEIPACTVLVNNAGGALGLDPIADSVDERWIEMFERNVLGTMRMMRAMLPKLVASGDGRMVTVGSTAAHGVYEGGAGYTSAKHAQRALSETLRLEILGQPVRVIEIDPGMVETEFSLTRFDGDTERAASVYAGVTPLVAEDIADCITWAVTRPSHVNIDSLIVRPRQQAGMKVHRDSTGT